jgi:hypothetical protein
MFYVLYSILHSIFFILSYLLTSNIYIYLYIICEAGARGQNLIRLR